LNQTLISCCQLAVKGHSLIVGIPNVFLLVIQLARVLHYDLTRLARYRW
jgi:hypothetical protein